MASEAVGGTVRMNTRVIKVADFKSKVIGPPRSFGGHHVKASEAVMALEAVMASEAVVGNMHMDTRVIRVDGFNSEVKLPLRLFGGCHGLGGHWRQYVHGYWGNQGC